jgi:signal transduction histidine kinase
MQPSTSIAISIERLLGPLAANPSLFSAFLEEVSAGVMLFDHEGHPLVHNRLFTEIVGVVPPLVQQVDGEPGAPAVRALAGEVVSGEERALRASGTPEAPPQRVLASAMPLREGTVILGGILVLRPVIDAEAGIREILGVVGHDLRNPLAAIRMTAQLLLRGDDMPTERRITLAGRLMTSSARMDSMVKSLLDYARSRAGAVVKLTREPVDLEELVKRIVAEQEHAHPGRGADVHSQGAVSGSWDPGRLEQIVGHLVANAFRHGAETPRARVEIDGRSSGEVLLAIQNGGPAIAPSVLEHLFNPFEIGPRPPGTPRRQIGLGLFVVRELVEAHGGSVSVTSTDIEGTRFLLRLPRSAPGVTST